MINWEVRTVQSELGLPASTATRPLAQTKEGVRSLDLYPVLKRLLDVVIASVLLLVLAPVMAAVAIAIRLDTPGPIVFRQARVGKNRRTFTFYKFRSMYHNADHTAHREFVTNLINGNGVTHNGQTVYKLTGDRRITRVGAFIRKTSLDELPQLVNVLKGEMSLVGPRPPIPYEVAAYKEWHKRRLDVPPGLTGLWQVRARSAVSFDEMVMMDIEYVSRRSLLLDLEILARTVPAVVSGRGAA